MKRHRGYDPARRNRNIGTSKQGHGRDNWMGVPWPDGCRYDERLEDPVLLVWEIHGSRWDFLMEPVLEDFAYALTPDDVARVIELLPAEDLEGLDLVVFQQPTRKQQMLEGRWGHWALTERLGPRDRKYRWGAGTYRWPHGSGPAIFLEALPIQSVVRWSKHLRPDFARELERLRDDGLRIVEDKRHHLVHFEPEACRTAQLYRVLPHEIGHHVDYWRKVMLPSRGKSQAVWERHAELYWSRPESEREAFADRYADTFRERMFASGEFPFPRTLDPEVVATSAIHTEWFSGTLDISDPDASDAPRRWSSVLRRVARLFRRDPADPSGA